MDEDETLNKTKWISNNTFDEDDEVYTHRDGKILLRVFVELFTIVGLLSIFASFLVIFVIIKYKKLQRNITNIIILHITILHAIYMFCTPLTLRFAVDIGLLSDVHMLVFCVINDIEGVLILSLLLFFVLLVANWYLKVYNEVKYNRFKNVYKFFIALIYVFGIFASAIVTQLCIRFIFLGGIILFVDVIAFILMLIFILIMNIVHRIKSRKLSNNRISKNVGLVIANIYIICWLPDLTVLLINIACYNCVAPLVLIILTIFGFASPIFNVIFLYCYDDNFHIFIKKMLKCQCNTYDNDCFEDTSVIYNEERGVEIYGNNTNHAQIS